METRIQFACESLRLEGLLGEGTSGRGVVITHPHPLYGGDMTNGVVETLARAYGAKGYTTLRFNFRGVGNSQGIHAEGAGEQEDVRAARALLKDRGIPRVDLAGYSFGAWVNARLGCLDSGVDRMVMISPPVAFIDHGAVGGLPCLKLVVTGSRDAFAPVDRIEQMLLKWNAAARFAVIPGADHFYGGCLDELESVVSEIL